MLRVEEVVVVEEVVDSVLEDGWHEDDSPVLRRVLVAEVEKRDVSRWLRRLHELYPLTADLSHLKRVSKSSTAGRVRVLLGEEMQLSMAAEGCASSRGLDVASCPDELTLSTDSYGHLPPLEVETAQVPFRAARTLAQHTSGCLLWECNKPLKKQESGTPAEVRALVAFVRLDDSGSSCALSGAVLCDPTRGNAVVASAGEERRLRSGNALLLHGPLLAIDALARRHRAARSRGGPHAQYLATGLDMVTTVEPCVMCAMALVHSRIRRVAFKRADPVHGGLGSTANVHTLRSINHRYRAWRYSV